MIPVERFLAERIAGLSEGPDRAILARWHQAARDYNTGKEPEAVSRVDLRQQTYELLRHVRQPSEQEREVLTGRGIVFLPLGTKSYSQVVAENPGHFLDGELDYANARPQLRDYALPVAVEAGFNPTKLVLLDMSNSSLGRSRQVQLQMLEDYSQNLQAEFPDARVIMLPSTGYAEADRIYRVRTGKLLIRDFFARALDDFSLGLAACAGRRYPTERFDVSDWLAARGYGRVVAVPALVFVESVLKI